MKKKRVVAWGSGLVGTMGIRGIIEHPELELVGLHAYLPEKLGKDAGELVGLPPLGVTATNDVEALLALEADCLAYFANGRIRMAEAAAEIGRFLRRGTNVATTTLLDLIYPDLASPALRDPLQQACVAGDSSLFVGGLNPGFLETGLPLTLLSIAGRVDSIGLEEIVDMTAYKAGNIEEIFGLGKPPGFVPMLLSHGIIDAWYGASMKGLAAKVGFEIDAMEVVHDIACMDYDIECAFGTIRAGTAAAVQFGLIAKSKGRPVLSFHQYYRLNAAAAPHWTKPWGKEAVSYRVVVKGDPGFTNELNFPMGGGTTAMHVVNAIPALCAARPGILSPTDLPLYYSRNVGRA